MIKLVQALLFLLVASVAAQTAVKPAGDGSEANPYQIATLENLYWLSQNINNWGVGGKIFEQTADIDASATKDWDNGAGFWPIGDGGSGFTGYYNGKGYSVKNLYINRPSIDYVGLFGDVSGNGTLIENLSVPGAEIYGKSVVGALAGVVTSATVRNVYSSGVLQGTSSVGGLVGCNSEGTITQSYSTARVSGTQSVGGLVGMNWSGPINSSYATGVVTGNTSVGGLVGYNRNTITASYYNKETSGQSTGIGSDDNNQTVVGLSATAMRSQTSFEGWDFSTVWAIAEGSTYPVLQGLDNAPFAFADSLFGHTIDLFAVLANDYDYETHQSALTYRLISMPQQGLVVAGVYTFEAHLTTGTRDTLVYQVGEVQATGDTLWGNEAKVILVKPFPGKGTETEPYEVATLAELQFLSEQSRFWNAHFVQTADIDASATKDWDGGAGFMPIGNRTVHFTGQYNGKGHVIDGLTIDRPSTDYVGLFGYLNAASIDSLGVTHASIVGQSDVGVIAGRLVDISKLSYSYATGSVYGQAAYMQTTVGGLVGLLYGSSISHSYAAVSVASLGGDVGGLVGHIYGSSIFNSYATGSVSGVDRVGGLVGETEGGQITNCYASGKVVGTDYVGGFMGDDAITITASYYNSETSGQNAGIGGDDITQTVTALTTTQMQAQANFVDWDFTDTWVIYEGHTMPMLRSFLKPLVVATADTAKVYDGQAISTPKVVYNIEDWDAAQVLGTATISGDAAGAVNTGSYTYTADGGLYSTQQGYLIEYSQVPATYKVTPAPLTVTATAKTKTYGATDPDLSYTITGLVDSDGPSVLSGAIEREAGESVGEYAISQGELVSNDNYKLTFVGSELTITRAPLTIAVVDKKITLGDKLPTDIEFTFQGLVNGDTPSDILGVLATYSCGTCQEAGEFQIIPSAAMNPNYEISYLNGVLTIEKPLSVIHRRLPQAPVGQTPVWDLLGRKR